MCARAPKDTVATTWQVSLEQVRPVPGALGLVEVCAFLGPEEIPRELFATRLDPPAVELAMLADDPFALDDAVAALHRLGLAKISEQTLIVHRLLQQVVRDGLDSAAASDRAGTAVRLLAKAFPWGYADPAAWPACASLLPHAVAAVEHAQQHGVELAASSTVLDRAESYLHGRGRYEEARKLAEQALTLAEMVHGPEHPTTAARLTNLATVLHAQRDLDSARTLHKRALAIYEARRGPDHPDTATSLTEVRASR
jgi:tetratricopeptide (TPR) repeat protein